MQIIASKEKQQERLSMCFSCPSIGTIPIVNLAKCNACGCPIRTKIVPESSKCPKGKW